jgi:hypothetical protein
LLKTPIFPNQETCPEVMKTEVVEHVVGTTQLPPYVTAPVESTETMLPSQSESVRIGAVSAKATPTSNNISRSTGTTL